MRLLRHDEVEFTAVCLTTRKTHILADIAIKVHTTQDPQYKDLRFQICSYVELSKFKSSGHCVRHHKVRFALIFCLNFMNISVYE